MDSKQLKEEIALALENKEITFEELERIRDRSSITLLAEILHTVLCEVPHTEEIRETEGCPFYAENSLVNPWVHTYHKRWTAVANYLISVSGRSLQGIIEDIRAINRYRMIEPVWIAAFCSVYKHVAGMTEHVIVVKKILNPVFQVPGSIIRD